jgi:peptidoglycan/LPS O-acetylase OafA/YrhL
MTKNVSNSSGREYLNGLSWLRFFLAVYLILFHTIRNYKDIPEWLISATSAGYVSTSIFFALSGFVLTHVYHNEKGEVNVSKSSFLINRFATLYPLHIVGFVLAAIIMFVQYTAMGHVIAVADIPLYQSPLSKVEFSPILLTQGMIWFNALTNIFLIHAWNPFYLTFNIPSWSISALAFFYIVFTYAGKRIHNVRHPLIAIALLNMLYIMPPMYFILTDNYSSAATGFLHTNPIVRLPEFLCGMLLWVGLSRVRWPIISFWAWLLIISGLVMLQVFIINVMMGYGAAGFFLAHNGILLPFQLTTIIVFSRMPKINTPKINDILDRLGNATLSLFMLHLPLFYILSHLEKFIIAYLNGSLASLGFVKGIKSVNPSIWNYPIILFATICICVLVQERFVLIVRRPLQKLMANPFKFFTRNKTQIST